MSDMKACLIRARDAKEVNVAKANQAIADFDARADYHQKNGMPRDVAERKAAVDLVTQTDTRTRQKKRASLRNMVTLMRHEAAIAKLPADQLHRYMPDLMERIHNRADTVGAQVFGHVTDMLMAYEPKMFGLQRVKAGLDDVAYAMYGDVRSPEAAQFAKGLKAMEDQIIRLLREAGIEVNQLKDWRLPQMHDSAKVRRDVEAWVEQHLHDVDWDAMRSFRNEAIPTDEAGRRALLRDIADTIISDGWAKQTAGGAPASLATKYAHRRFLIYKDAAAWVKNQNQFGQGDLFQAMLTYAETAIRDITIAQELGTSPSVMFANLTKTVKNRAGSEVIAAVRGAKKGAAADKAALDIQGRIASNISRAEDMFGIMTRDNVADPGSKLALTMSTLRNVTVSAKMGSALLPAIGSDLATMRFVAAQNGMDATKMAGHYMTLLNPSNTRDRDIALQLGLIADAAVRNSSGFERFFGEISGPAWSKVAANFTLRAGGLTHHTQAAQWAFGMEFMGALARDAGKTLDQVEIRPMLERNGITPEIWDQIRQTPLWQHPDGAQFLRPKDIFARKDLTETEKMSLFNAISDALVKERNAAVVTSSLESRAILGGNIKRGTLTGEVVASMAMFKGFAVSVIMNHGLRTAGQPLKNRMAYMASFIAQLTVAGAFANQMYHIANGRDPQSVRDPAFWGAAALKGGGMGIYGDFFFANANRYGGGLAETLAGPIAQFLNDTRRMTVGNAMDFINGDDPKFMADFIKWFDRNMPGSNLWYLREAKNRILVDELLKLSDPDAYEAFRRKDQNDLRNFKTARWWPAGQTTPQRAPEIGAMFEEPPQ